VYVPAPAPAPTVGYAQPSSAYVLAPPVAPAPTATSAPPVTYAPAAPNGQADRGAALSARADLRGVELGLRMGLALPGGDAAPRTSLSDLVTNHIPLWIDLGYRFNDRVAFGVYGQYGVLNPKCTGSCSGYDARFGLQLHAHLQPRAATDPWVGVGAGYEIMEIDPRGEAAYVLEGFELLNLQMGIDWRASQSFTLGPFLSVTASEFSKVSHQGGTKDVGDDQMHEWVTLGLRGLLH
jgi:hypothetical protein